MPDRSGIHKYINNDWSPLLFDCNPSIISFLKGLVNVNFYDDIQSLQTLRIQLQIVKAIEQLYSLSSVNYIYIGNINFTENLLLYNFSQSRMVADIHGSLNLSGKIYDAANMDQAMC